MTDNRVAVILVDYPRQQRLKILGRAQIFEGAEARDWIVKVRDPAYKATIDRVFAIQVEALDWNCSQHIIPRFTEEEIRQVLEPVERRMQELQDDNKKLRERLASAGK